MKTHPSDNIEPVVTIKNYGDTSRVSVFGLDISRGCRCIKLDHTASDGAELTATISLNFLERNIRELDEAKLDEFCGNIRKFWLASNAHYDSETLAGNGPEIDLIQKYLSDGEPNEIHST